MSNSNTTAEQIASEIAALERSSRDREQRAEREAAQPPSVARLRAALASARAAGAAIQRVGIAADVDLAAIDPQLRESVGAARRAAVRAERSKEAEAILDRAVSEIAGAREGADALTDARAHRRRATFDPQPATDATIRAAWIARLDRVSVPDLVDFASIAIETRSVALASATEEELLRREPLGSPADRSAASEAHRRIDTMVPPAVAEARALLVDLDVIERTLREQARVIAGGVASGASEIAIGLLQRQADAAA